MPAGPAMRLRSGMPRVWARVFRFGLLPRRWVTLEVRGRRSGKITASPLGMT